MARTMALTAAAVVCGGLVGFAATSYASSDAPGGSSGAFASTAASGDEREQEHDHGRGPHHWFGHHGPMHGGAMLHGESVLEDPDTGEITTWAHQQGEVTERSDGSVTVESSDGTAWEWTLTDDTVVHAENDKVKVGDTVIVGGPRDGEARTAEHIGTPPSLPEDLPEPDAIRKHVEEFLDGLELPRFDGEHEWRDEGHQEEGHEEGEGSASLPS